ncbi:MAG: ATP-binding protein, partial [Gammaproteobacteria bacterium]|nr:ATP-binding protein [Gammaproteobacteria bacterium]
NEASNKVLFSSDTKKIPPNSDINELKKDYLLTGKSFFDYGASDLRLQFASFISKSDATKITDHILSINNYQRMILVIIMLLTFSIIMLAFTKRLTALRQNVINYSTNELGSCTEDLIQGDELTILEKQFEKLVGEIKTSQQQLQRSQRMDAMGQLTGGVAHDFNNILAAILGFSQLAQKKYGKTPGLEKLDDYLLEIIIAGERGRDLVSAMLTYCRGEVGDEKTFSIADEINTAISMLRPTTPTSINISTNIGPDNEDISIKADPVRFSQVIINMIINARDEMENEIGLINITIKPSSFISGHCASCNSEFSGNYIELCISDTGKGIDPEIITRIFEPFYTTKKTGQGTGMGLSILHGFIHASGGHISVDSKPGSGSRFKLLLPQVAQEIAAAPDHESHDQSHTSTRPARLLIIDDETAITKLLHEVFEQHNYAVTSFNEPNEALAYFKRDPDNFDLVITDQSMPNLTGKELVLEALKTRPGIPIIMCSGYSAMINEASALELGISMYMEKPLQIDKLLDAVAQLINKQKD